jgi:dienelactone hydrolase
MHFSRSVCFLFGLLIGCSFTIAAVSDGEKALRAAAAMARQHVPATQPAVGFSDAKLSNPKLSNPKLSNPGVNAIFYAGADYEHKSTRVFAWYGFPPNMKPGVKVPAMVLVHGGGGTAFAEWVRLWNKAGYAAIAMDTCGCVPIGSDNHWQRDSDGGPAGWGGFGQIDQPVTDQWTYHAVLNVILANSLIRSWPEVDADRVGLTGISWGGYLTCIVAGLDQRFKFACPVYGCGFLGDDSAWIPDLKSLGPARSHRWLNAWDPSVYLPEATMPMLWVDGTNDAFYPLDSLSKSYRLPRGSRTLVMRIAMKHSHRDGWSAPEIAAFADSICKHGQRLAKITSQKLTGQMLAVVYDSDVPIKKAELNFTTDDGEWSKRNWQSQPARLLPSEKQAQVAVPERATAYYLNMVDTQDRLVSSDLSIKPE